MTKTNSLTPLSVDDCQIDGENQNEHTEIESSDEAILDSCEMVATENRNENTADEQNSMQMLSATEQFSGDDAQDMPIDSSFRMIRSQFAQNVINYTDQPVSHSLGKTDITIPLYTVKCGSLELPITLTYNSSGIKVNDIAGPVGLGWTLNAGGAIVRDVRGSKDLLDTGGKEYLGRLQKPHSEQIGNSTSILSVEGITSSAQDDVLKMADKSCEEDNAYDKFYYYHPKGSGSFYMTDTIPYFNEGAKDESWHSISESRKFCCNNDNISYSLKLTENIYDEFRDRWVSYITKLDTFKITTDTGEVYSYKIAGGGVRSKDNWSRCDDCSRFNKNKNNKETSEEDFGGVSWSNWCVNKIESVDGLNSIQLENTPIANFYKDVLFDSCEYSRPFTTQNSNYFIKTNNDSWHDRSNLTTTRCYNVVHSVKKITFNGNEIEFKYRTQIFKNPYENAYFKEDPNVISTKERRLHLSEIVVKKL